LLILAGSAFKNVIQPPRSNGSMKILIIGAGGFIGGHLARCLIASGQHVICGGRNIGALQQQFPGSTVVAVDYARDTLDDWCNRLEGVDVVINAAGLVRDHRRNPMEAVHIQGPQTLLQGCLSVGVKRLIHLSALGVGQGGQTRYQQTKGVAEQAFEAIDSSSLEWCILRPSLVAGQGGASTAMLAALAVLPRLPRLGAGEWQIQPVHVSDLAALVVGLVSQSSPLPKQLDVVGPEVMTTDALLQTFRQWLGLKPGVFVSVPEPLLNLFAAVGEWLADGPANREVLTMLRAGNVGDVQPMTQVLGRLPQPLGLAMAQQPARRDDRQSARLYFLGRPLRWSLGLMWLITGLLSFGIYPVTESQRLLAQVGLVGLPAMTALYGAAVLDLILGTLLLLGWRPVAVGTAQLALMTAFSLIAIGLPAEYWLHPFAPLIKNLPLLAATAVMMALEAEVSDV
jgi:uncharacterized protein YbjT (DUF2867 family)